MASFRPSIPAFSISFQTTSVLLIWVFMLARVDCQNRSDEVRTLLDWRLYNSVPFGAYTNSWKESDENACAWVGVTCTNNYTVSALDFSGWTFGEASDSTYEHLLSANLNVLANLKDLRQLDLSSNKLKSIQLENLTEVASLDISSNFLTLFPEGLWNLTGLTHLDLSFNSIAGRIPPNISACRSLRYISLQQNNLSGEIPSLDGLVDLKFLFLANNQLSGPFPRELGRMTSLLLVDLSHNSLNGTVFALPNVTDLLELYLDNNNFTAFEQPWFLVENSPLRGLSVSLNQLEGSIPPFITNLTNLVNLNMSHNRLSGIIPSGFSAIYSSPSKFPSHLYPLSVDLSHNLLSGTIPTDMLVARGCCSLNLSHNLLTGAISGLGLYNLGCYNLVLDLSYNALTGAIPSNNRVRKPMLSYLWLQNNRLSGDIGDVMSNFQSWPSLDLRLQNNLFTGDLSRIMNMTSLLAMKYIDLSNNELRWTTSAAIPDPISATLESLNLFEILEEVRLGGNNFSGTSISNACFMNMTLLAVLDLSNSHLNGQLLGASLNRWCLPSLQVLNFSNNDISGPVPSEVSMIPSLRYLDLSHNNLSGSLPPISPNSSLFNPNSFVGNDALCGLPLNPCPAPDLYRPETGIASWILVLTIGGALTMALGSCLAATWRWRVYQKKHEQDADLIKTLMERDSAVLMPLREIKRATDNFAQSAQIGEGGFGAVYIGKLEDGTMVAMKRSKRDASEQDKEQFLNEVRILSQINHRNLVKLLGCCLENKIAVLVFEFIPNGTLQDHLRVKMRAARLSWKQRLNIAVQTANALNYLHTSATFPIYHRDVKSANILLTDDLDAKVADFGISRLAPVQATHVSTLAVQGTMGYIDPEYYTSYQLTDKSDVFSFGVVLLELISAKPALDFSRGGDDNSLINFASGRISNGDLDGLIDAALMDTYSDPAGHGRESILSVGRLAMRCVDMRSKVRPSMNEVLKELEHLWVSFDGRRDDVLHSMTEDEHDLDNHIDDGATGPDFWAGPEDQTIFLSKSFSSERITEGRRIQMSQSMT